MAAALLAFGCGRASPDNLAIGDCIDLPSGDAISSVPKRSCTQPHAGEVFHLFDVPSGDAYPSDPEWGPLIYPVCDPAFEAYTGTNVEDRADIDYQFFVPTEDRWAAGERSVTCYIISLDGSPLARSYRVSR
ncbi:MAG TPA: septum formation family protein [Candidatus Limnocylindrales bacterium]|nr:septum formation family protein [Candidatus Limnocylindrales bacterium]